MRAPRPATALIAAIAIATAGLIAAPIAASAAPTASIRINEVESEHGTPGDWIELLNTGTVDVDLTGYVVKDDKDTSSYVLPAGSIVAPGAFLVLDELIDGVGHFTFGLGGSDKVRLFDPSLRLVEERSWTGHAATSMGVRDADGATEWIATTASTKGAANTFPAPVPNPDPDPIPTPTPTVVVNEIVYDAVSGVALDSIELYNVGSVTADLSGWKVADDKGTEFGVLTNGTTLAPGAFLVLTKDTHFPFGLGKGDTVTLLNASSAKVDEYAFAGTAPLATWARCPDGTGAWAHATEVTLGAANTCAPIDVPAEPGSIRINEVDSQPSDWVEFFNPGDSALDISGYEVRDNSDDHQWRFPAGSSIDAGEYLVVESNAVGLVLDDGNWVTGTFEGPIGIGGGDQIRLYDTSGHKIDDTLPRAEHAAIGTDLAVATFARCPDGVGEFRLALITKGAANDCVPTTVAVNEINSNGTDWVEIKNVTAAPIDISGWTIMDDDPIGHAKDVTPLPTGTFLAPGAYRVLTNGIEFSFGLGKGDTVTLRDATGTTVDDHTYAAHATGFWARCPDGLGAFKDVAVGTAGSTNSCAGAIGPVKPPLVLGAWPGSSAVTVLDPTATFLQDSSGLDSQLTADGAVLWAIDNGTGTFWKLNVAANGSVTFANGWATGKRVRFQKDAANPTAAGPDTEGITIAGDGFIYVASERDNSAKAVNFNSVLKVDPAAAGPDLVALQEWDLTAALPTVGANLGIEAVEWVADSALTGTLWDDTTNAAYTPATYPLHGGGLFFVAVEDGGGVFAFALNSDGTFTLVSTIDPGMTGVMALDYDTVLGSLWAVCDNGCGTASALITLNGTADPTIVHFARPAGLPDINNEGFATTPTAINADGDRAAWWFADGFASGSLRLGTLPGVALPPTGVDPAPVAVPDASLTTEARGGVTVPSQVTAGTTMVVTVGAELAGQKVRIWLHSSPVMLGEVVVASAGTASVFVPVLTAAGDHRVVVANTANELLGWAPVRISAAGLQSTGSETGWMGAAAIAALLMLGLGAGLGARGATRRRVAPSAS